MKLSEFVNLIRRHPEFGEAFVHHRFIPASKPVYGQYRGLRSEVDSALRELRINRLYKHQVDAIRHIKGGKNVVVATPTASGKSLIYNISVLEAILENEKTKALYIFPLKALAQDQLKNLSVLTGKIAGRKITAQIYDGDTTPYRRKQIRTRIPEVLLTNPDMLHRAILAYHQNWKHLFENLRYVILDEIHTYRGIFGSHTNQVLRRLKRVCRLYGASPRFILLSATVNNPKGFGESLIEEEVEVISSSGSPRSGQHFLFLNPDTSSNFAAARLFVRCLRSGYRTIVFTQSRKITELIHIWTAQLSPDLRKKVSPYRAGFMPEERRDIEKRLASGNLLGVVSTSALEMGIDIGYLDICLLVGYPGTIIKTWQRGGRVGRSGKDSMVILIAKPDALDQYFMRHPADLFERSYEAAVLDPNNPCVVQAHLPCAAAEKPITLVDDQFWPKDLSHHLETLETEGSLSRTADGKPTWFATKRNPHLEVNIRSVGESYTIFEKATGQAIGTVDVFRAFKECHPGAVYLHRAARYLVDRLIPEKKDIIVHRTGLKYFTRVRSEKETEIIQINRSRPRGQFLVREGSLKVTEWVIGYEKRALPGQELIGVFELDLPPQTFETTGFWIEIEPAIKKFVEEEGLHFMGGIHAIEHGTIGIFPLFALCDRDDIGGIAHTHHSQVGKSAIFIYDGYPGGVGLAQHGFEIIMELLGRALDLIKNCECDEGCPSCIHSPKCGSGNKPLDKRAAVVILEFLLGQRPLGQALQPYEQREPEPVRNEKDESVQTRSNPRIIYFDLETRRTAQEVGGWQNTHLMRVSVAVIFDSLENRYFSFAENNIADLLSHFQRADLVVGFNVKRFDYGVLGAYSNRDLGDLNTFDMLEDVQRRLGFRLGLNHLAVETLNQPKTADGLQAVAWFRQGEMKKLEDYCRHDVATTRDLFLYGLKKGHIIYRTKKEGRRVRLAVDWNLEELIPDRELTPGRSHEGI